MTNTRFKSKEELAEEWIDDIAPALQTEYHRLKHRESYLAGFTECERRAETLVEALEKIRRDIRWHEDMPRRDDLEDYCDQALKNWRGE